MDKKSLRLPNTVKMVVTGPPYSGKTQAMKSLKKMLVRYGFQRTLCVDMSDVLRGYSGYGTIESFISGGLVVPVEHVVKALNQHEADVGSHYTTVKNLIIFGFPRDVVQAEIVIQQDVPVAIIDTPEEICRQRSEKIARSPRHTDDGKIRSDDTLEKILERWKVYENHTQQAIDRVKTAPGISCYAVDSRGENTEEENGICLCAIYQKIIRPDPAKIVVTVRHQAGELAFA